MSIKCQERPRFIFIAGPNGSGKTTLATYLREHEWGKGSIFVNADEKAQELGDWNNDTFVAQAQKIVQQDLAELMEKKQDIMYESVLSHPSKIDLIKKAKELGYFCRFFFVSTTSPLTNINRVAKRQSEGGHKVAPEKIDTRYCRSFINAAMAMRYADRGYFCDNSVDLDKTPDDNGLKIIFRTENGKIVKINDAGSRWLPTYQYFLHTFLLDRD